MLLSALIVAVSVYAVRLIIAKDAEERTQETPLTIDINAFTFIDAKLNADDSIVCTS
jgi:hypothetical protein